MNNHEYAPPPAQGHALQEFIAYLPIVLAPLILFAPTLFSGKALFWGTPALQFIPWSAYAWESVLSGSLPLWNPLNGMGAPLAANYQTALFYPPNWISLAFYALGKTPALAWAQTLLIVIHLIWAGLGMALLVKQLGCKQTSQVISGLAFSLSGYLVTRVSFFSMIWCAAWLPWVILCAGAITSPTRLSLRGTKQSVMPLRELFPILLIICLAFQFLSGHAQLTWYTLMLAIAWVSMGGWQQSGWRGMLKAVLRFSGAAVIAAALSAIQLLPTAELLLQSQRAASVDFNQAVTYSLWGWRLLGFIVPDLFGNPASGNFWGYATYWEDAVYLGLIPFLLAAGSFILIFLPSPNTPHEKSYKPLLIFLWALIGISIVLALGKNSQLFMLLFQFVPTFNMFNSPARYLIWAEFALALLAGISLDRWQAPTGKKLYWTRLAVAGSIFAITVDAYLLCFYVTNSQGTAVRAIALVGPWICGAGILALLTPSAQRIGIALPARFQGKWNAALILWVVADLLFAGWLFNPSIGASFYASPAQKPSPASALVENHRIYLPPQDEYDLKFTRFLRFTDFAPLEPWDGLRYVLLPNINLLDNLASANNFEPMVSGRYAVWMSELKSIPTHQLDRWMALMDVQVVETARVGEKGGIALHQVSGAQRFRWMPCAVNALDGNDALAQVSVLLGKTTSEAYLNQVVIEGLTQPTSITDDCTPQIAQVDLLKNTPDHILLRTNATQPGWLLAADTWYPGWVARIDGIETPLYRANYLFRAVSLEAGQHTLEFIYHPTSFYAGAAISLFTLIGLLAISVRRPLKNIIAAQR